MGPLLRLPGLPLLGLILVIGGCSTAPQDPQEGLQLCLPRAGQAVPIQVEVAATQAQRQQGLQGRESLDRRSGMLFLYDQSQPPEQGFWMFRTRIPLSVAWLDRNGQVVGMQSMSPCSAASSTECQVYPAGVSFQAALEVNDGLFEQLGVNQNDTVRVASGPREQPCASSRPFSTLLD
ncbi:MAG: DUF192 domain-containing protein [Halomonadaceae bacterium]|nr:MAG: DUF192 domain-containing protein [Halomonadaceae bacterium]